MKNRLNKKVIFILIFAAILLFFINLESNAASASINCEATTELNKTITISVSGNAVQWNLKLIVDGTVIASSSELDNVQGNIPISFSGTYTPTTVGNKNIQLEGSITEASDGSTIRSFASKSITVNSVISNEENNNETNSNTNGDSTISNNNNDNNNNNNNNISTKSSNANLSNLGIRPNDFSGFKPGTTTYNVTVPNEVTSIELYATKQDSKATISGTGNKQLQEGVNTFVVTVTAEDETTKKYTVNVTRQATEKKEEDETTGEQQPEETNDKQTKLADGLEELEIEGIDLSPAFKTDVYEYTAKYVGEDTKLNVKTKPTDNYYTVEITGNEDLKEGENVITILVSDPDGNNIATYQILVNKSLVDEEILENEQEEAIKQKEKRNKIIAISASIVLILIVVIILIIKHIKNRPYSGDYTVPYSGLNEEDDEEQIYEEDNSYQEKQNVEENNDFEEEYKSNNKKDDIETLMKKNKRNKGKRFK